MGNKNKEKRKARKRQLSNSKCNEDLEVIEISMQKKRLLEDNCDIIQATSADIHKKEIVEILPTREILGTQLVTAVRNRHFAIIEGPLGCGKTFLARYAARKLDLSLNIMQMGDQIDSKTLFGSYHCTEVAGQFVWKESTFSKWLKSPSIILLEDIDAANADVISKIVEIAACRQTDPSNVENGKSMVFHENVRIVATMSGKGKKAAVLDGVPVRIRLDKLSDDELKRLASKSFPRIAHLTRNLISIFRKIESFPGTGNSRQLTSTDFLRGCSRLSRLPDISANVESFAELVDVWCLADPKERALELCNRVSGSLNVHSDRVHTHMSIRQPDVKYDDKTVSVGRAHLPRKISMIKTGRHRLGHTRDVVQLMERIVVCVSHKEPLLLVGETGVGKTSVVQAVADLIGVTLDVVNVSPTSDSDELIQGYKPTTIGRLLEPFTKFYMEVFSKNFDISKNQKFIDNLEKCLSSGRFHDYLSLVETTAKKALQKKAINKDERWAELLVRSKQIRNGLEKGAAPFALQKGAVLEAAEKGHWLLVDEINLAPPECLDAIVHALSANGTHPDFRLFACMNPATDAGKRRLPPGVRTKFTEFFVSETHDPYQLALIVSAYLPTLQQANVENLVRFYLQSKQLYPASYSLRTLCRALLFTADNMFGSVEQSIYEAVSMAFLTNMQNEEKTVMRTKIQATFKYSAAPMPTPKDVERFVKIGGYFIEKGTISPEVDSKYVITKTVKSNLAEISRIVCSGRFPILLEGETSAGKTSIVCHLAKVTGNKIVRINNHEHTDVQEYMGSYVADAGGRLVFREGALVQAVRDGSWVILDELNLAPTDVIEALNRLLDDNRELFVSEINETIKAHPRFRLFATQNPAGSYAGRKKLSRALMSRFIVLRFQHLPIDELSEMVCARCGVPPTAALKMIEVLNELRNRRSLSGLFSARDGLMTLRDVFRWAKRMTTDETIDDWLQILVNHGYFLLAGRCRNEKDEQTVVETLEKVIKRNIEIEKLFCTSSAYMPKDVQTDGVVLTLGMRRMLVLTEQAWLRNEAVLMVGETGGGKTTLSEVVGRGKLRSINCHERTETADLLGRLRPKQDGGFEWSDGVVISSMRDGVPLLIDEISLAEDSVLERLNPLFEEDRCLLLSDAGTETQVVHSTEGFQMIATMNPGGDYGKKELSKALRNRFTEVWTASDYTTTELMTIFDQRLAKVEATRDEAKISPSNTSKAIVAWIVVFFEKYSHVFRHAPSVRDVVACAELYSSAMTAGIDSTTSIKDSICAVFLDSLAGLTTRLQIDPNQVLDDALGMLHSELEKYHFVHPSSLPLDLFLESIKKAVHIQLSSNNLSIGHIHVNFGSNLPKMPKAFSLKAPTCAENFYRIARGLLINKPILLEGAPGCGKSSTVMALAQLTGNPITRLNLSDQTDLSDLFGSDVPVLTEDGTMTFQWEDGPVLKAIKKGEWVLLDEMNLASQSVLEGLNACFDHRRVLYIAELNRSFEIPSTSKCRFFACQNPRVQGGNRRALPKSFVNRFTNIYTNDLTKYDIEIVLAGVDEKNKLTEKQRSAMVAINEECSAESDRNSFIGGPHSFNLRDLLRWYELGAKNQNLGEAFEIVYVTRMRRDEDRDLLRSIFEKLMNQKLIYPPVQLTIDEKVVKIGNCELKRKGSSGKNGKIEGRLVSSQMLTMHQIGTCVEMNWLALVVAPRNSGKRTIIENLAHLCGHNLRTIALNADTDAQELIGSYEQVVDENCLPNAKSEIVETLKKLKVDSKLIQNIENCEDLLKLEAVLELIMAEIGENEELRNVIVEANRGSMRFEWIDSVFVDAYLKGDWLLIEDVNLCSAAVLDRLNSCLESGGKLVVAERQNSYEPLEPHPDFRVFLSMDSRVGEISRAMRNRSVEIYMDEVGRWNTCSDDICAVVGENLTVELSRQMEKDMTPEQQLHLAVLLAQNPQGDVEEFSPEVACKLVGMVDEGMQMDDDEIEKNGNIAPKISDIGNLTNEYEKYVIGNWIRAARTSKGANIEAMLLLLLSTSPHILKEMNDTLKELLGGAAIDSFSKRVSALLDSSNSRHLVDSRFSGSKKSIKTHRNIKLFNASAVFEWMSQLIQKVPIEEGSAEFLSKTLTKYEIATCDVTFNNLPMISELVGAIVETWKKEQGIANDEAKEFSISLSLLLLIAAARRRLTTRTGCAAIYLAWNDLRKEIEQCHGVKMPKALLSITSRINEGWTSESYETYLNEYLIRWRSDAISRPFENEEQARRFIERLEEVLAEGSDEKEGNDVEMIDEDEDEEDRRKRQPIGASPVEISTNLVESVGAVFEFLAKGSVNESDKVFKPSNIYNSLNWSDEKKAKWVRTASVLCAQLATMKIDESAEDSELRTCDLLSIGGGAHCLAARLFFSALNFNPTLSNLSIAHLQKFSIHELGQKLWRLAVNSDTIRQKLRLTLEDVGLGIEGWNEKGNEKGWIGRIEMGIGMMKNALPPKETLDPVIFEEERLLFVKAKKRIVEKQLKMLGEWRKLMSRQESHCDAQSEHPVIRRMEELKEELAEMENSDENVAEKQEVYRQSAAQYNSLCAELRSFFDVVLSVIGNAKKSWNDDERLNEQQMVIRLARIKSFSMSASNFRMSTLRKFVSFVDVSMPFISGLFLVEIALNEVHLKWQQDAKRLNAEVSSAFPRFVETNPSSFGLCSNEVTTWAIRDASPMPLLLKSAVIRKRLSGIDGEIVLDIQWTRNQWKKWYERNISKGEQKDFVYRTKTEDEKDEMDVIEYFSKQEVDEQVLPDLEVSLLLEAIEKKKNSLVDPNTRSASDARFEMAKSWMRYVMSEVGVVPQDQLALVQCVYGDQRLFETLAKHEGLAEEIDTESTKIVDVYRNSSLRECRRVAEILKRLSARTKEVLERWPEVVSLRNIVSTIDEFFTVSVATPHIKMATQIEMLIETCEQWEMMADRSNSLRDPLGDLRKLLVEWKKMEVRCWSTLLENCENEAKQKAQLVAYPLFEALFGAETPEAESAIIPMSIEWMHNATLVDFSTRVQTVESLSKWAEIGGKRALAVHLKSAARHFGIFVEKVEKRLKDAREPAELNLKDYLKVVKYNDLNLWNIRVSSTKAHAQLYKIVRRFKDAITSEVFDDFDVLQQIGEWKKRLVEQDEKPFDSAGIENEEIGKRIRQSRRFAKQVAEKVSTLCDTTGIDELFEQTKGADEEIRKMINYVGEDAEKEKQQGYARNWRQRQVAMVIKESQLIGLNARRAVLLTQEDINRRSVVEVVPEGDCEKSIRICAAGRNIVIRKSNKVDQQVGVSTRKHLSGMIEYGMDYMLAMQKNIDGWNRNVEKIRDCCAELKCVGENGKEDWNVEYEGVIERIRKVEKDVEVVDVLVESMKRIVGEVPKTIDEQTRHSDYLHPLSRLTKSDDLANKLVKWVERIESLVGNLKRTNEEVVHKNGRVVERNAYITWTSQISGDIAELKAEIEQEKFEGFFDVEKREIQRIIQNVEKEIKKIESVESTTEKDTDITRLLLVIQNVFKGLEDKKIESSQKEEEEKVLDRITRVVEVLKGANLEGLEEEVDGLVKEHLNGDVRRKDIQGYVDIGLITADMIKGCVDELTNGLAQFSALYHAILSLTMQLYEKGYVNTIPKAEKQESGDGETDDTGEGGGIGEGGTAKDAKDVTDEMEESGQIEGLEDEQPVDSEEHESKNDNEKPIEMEDDFAEDLQDIDKNEKGDDKDGEDNSDDEEPEAEDQMGEVEEEDEKQLDPKMWDEEEKEEEEQQKNMDQEQQGADDQSNDMVAKEDDAQTKEQKEGEDEQQDDGDKDQDEGEEDQENVDERDRENDERNEDELPQNEKEMKGDDGEDDEMDDGEPDGEQEKMDGEDGDETDPEDIEGEGTEENENNEELEANQNDVNEEEEEAKKDDESEKMEQGTGGEKKEQDEKNDQKEGGIAEDEREETEEEEKDEKGDGKSRSDPRGKDGAGEKAKDQEDKKDDEEEDLEKEKEPEKQRQLATDNAEQIEEAEMGEGEENESGQQMDDAVVSERQMVGKGTLEEAKMTKKEDQKREEKRNDKKRQLKEGFMDEMGKEDGGEVEDENAEEVKEAHIHLASQEMYSLVEEATKELVTGLVDEDLVEKRTKSEEGSSRITNEKADEQWAAMSRTVGMLAAELAENLRLILEPQRANKMQGDYRSGKRLNMRRLIPYIASEYRKDRIWMRRTKRAQREYQILIAVDDSGSMNENGIHQVTCESVCIVEDALRRCDAGRVSVCSFGSDVTTIVPFGEASAASSIEMLKQLTFEQNKTDLLMLLKTAKQQLDEIRTGTSEQMLIVISDGRGTLSQGVEKVRALYSALQGVTVLFVILDSGKKSIEELSVASFKDGKVVLTPYLSLFPFPFYAIVKNVQQLPSVIAESIRQWFEMTTQFS